MHWSTERHWRIRSSMYKNGNDEDQNHLTLVQSCCCKQTTLFRVKHVEYYVHNLHLKICKHIPPPFQFRKYRETPISYFFLRLAINWSIFSPFTRGGFKEKKKNWPNFSINTVCWSRNPHCLRIEAASTYQTPNQRDSWRRKTATDSSIWKIFQPNRTKNINHNIKNENQWCTINCSSTILNTVCVQFSKVQTPRELLVIRRCPIYLSVVYVTLVQR